MNSLTMQWGKQRITLTRSDLAAAAAGRTRAVLPGVNYSSLMGQDFFEYSMSMNFSILTDGNRHCTWPSFWKVLSIMVGSFLTCMS